MHYKIGKMLFKEAKDIREKVFVEEQHFENEFDDIDSWAIHLVVYDKEAIGCARMYDDNGVMILGRIAVLKEKRALHAGSYILSVLEKHAGSWDIMKLFYLHNCKRNHFMPRMVISVMEMFIMMNIPLIFI